MKLNAFSYTLPFDSAFNTSNSGYSKREGVFLLLEHDSRLALGEASPLPGFSAESLEAVVKQLQIFGPEIETLFESDALGLGEVEDFCRGNDLLPSLRFGLETLALHYLCNSRSVQPDRILFEDKVTPPLVNGVIPLGPAEDMVERATSMAAKGYHTVKIKVTSDIEQAIKGIREIKSTFPEMTLRLDANKSWEPAAAIENLKKLEEFEFEYCEEPLQDATPQSLRKLRDEIDIPLALDESLLTISDLEAAAASVSAFVIKPMVFGGLPKIFATKRLADSHDIKMIFTSSLESGIGRHLTAYLAAGLGSGTAHGLATGRFLKIDVWDEGTYIKDGRYTFHGYETIEKGYLSNCDKFKLKQINWHGERNGSKNTVI